MQRVRGTRVACLCWLPRAAVCRGATAVVQRAWEEGDTSQGRQGACVLSASSYSSGRTKRRCDPSILYVNLLRVCDFQVRHSYGHSPGPSRPQTL